MIGRRNRDQLENRVARAILKARQEEQDRAADLLSSQQEEIERLKSSQHHFKDEDWPLALQRLNHTEPGPDQGIAVVGTDDLAFALERLAHFAQVAMSNAVALSTAEALSRSKDEEIERLKEHRDTYRVRSEAARDAFKGLIANVTPGTSEWRTASIHLAPATVANWLVSFGEVGSVEDIAKLRSADEEIKKLREALSDARVFVQDSIANGFLNGAALSNAYGARDVIDAALNPPSDPRGEV